MNTDIARTNIRTTPTGIVAVMLGADFVTLSGFAAEPMPPSWTRPGVVHVAAPIASDALVNEVLGAKRRVRNVERLAWALCALAALATGLAFNILGGQAPAAGPVSAHTGWQAVAVDASGVLIQSAENFYTVPVGSRLPNGERLLAVSPQRRAYTTQNATIILQGAP